MFQYMLIGSQALSLIGVVYAMIRCFTGPEWPRGTASGQTRVPLAQPVADDAPRERKPVAAESGPQMFANTMLMIPRPPLQTTSADREETK